jgi:arginine:agmatine antiporter
VAASLAALAIASVFIALGPAVPTAKGLPDYVQAGLGRFFGVQCGVAYWSNNWVGDAALGVALAGTVGYLVPGLAGEAARLPLTLAFIWVAVAAAWIGPRMVARVEGLTLGIGLLPVVVAAIFGWFAFHPAVFLANWNPQGLTLTKAAGSSGLTAFWGFLGVECAAAVAGVVRDPARNVPRATLLGVSGVAVLYIAACTVLMGILPAGALAASSAPFADASRTAFGVGVGALIAVCALLRAFGCLTGWTLVSAETTRTAADGGMFPALFRTRPGERASTSNLLAMGVLTSLMAIGTVSPTLGQQFSVLANVSVLLTLYSYALSAASLIRITGPGVARRRAILSGAVLAIGACIALAASARPIELELALVPLAAAALLHLWLRRR